MSADSWATISMAARDGFAPRRSSVRARTAAAALAMSLLVAVVLGFGPALLGTPVALAQDGDDVELTEPTADADAVRNEARRLLSEPPFASEDQGRPPQGIEGGTSSGEPQQPPPEIQLPTAFEGLGAVGQAIVWVVAAMLVALAVWLIVRVVSTRSSRVRKPETSDDVQTEGLLDEAPWRSADDWMERAARFERDGAFREALRCRLRALVCELVERSVLGDVTAQTTGELADAVGEAAPRIAVPFRASVLDFDEVWYGGAAAGAEICAGFARRSEQIIAAVDAAPRASAATVGSSGGDGGEGDAERPDLLVGRP